MRPPLIDTAYANTMTPLRGGWFRAKPMQNDLLHRLHHAWLVLRGRAVAVVFMEDVWTQYPSDYACATGGDDLVETYLAPEEIEEQMGGDDAE